MIQHKLHEIDTDADDKALVCFECPRVVALDATGKPSVVNQGDFYALHSWGDGLKVEVNDEGCN